MELDFYQYFIALKRFWWLIIAMVLLTVGAGLAYSSLQTSIYEAEIVFLASPNLAISDTSDLIDGLGTISRNSGIAVTSCEILESQSVREEAAIQMGLALDVVNEYDVTCVVLPDTTILKMRVQGESPELAADLANAIGVSGIRYINELYEIVKLRFLDSAEVNSDPISPNHVVNVGMSAVIGVVAALGFIIIRETIVQLFGSASPENEDFLPDLERSQTVVSVALLTLDPQAKIQLKDPTRQQKKRVQQELAQQIREYLQQNIRVSDLMIYLESKKFVLIMPDTNRVEADGIIAKLVADLQENTFTLPEMDISVFYHVSVGVVENENKMLQWNDVLKACHDVEQLVVTQNGNNALLDRDVALADVS